MQMVYDGKYLDSLKIMIFANRHILFTGCDVVDFGGRILLYAIQQSTIKHE